MTLELPAFVVTERSPEWLAGHRELYLGLLATLRDEALERALQLDGMLVREAQS